jgi:hypothetical protein
MGYKSGFEASRTRNLPTTADTKFTKANLARCKDQSPAFGGRCSVRSQNPAAGGPSAGHAPTRPQLTLPDAARPGHSTGTSPRHHPGAPVTEGFEPRPLRPQERQRYDMDGIVPGVAQRRAS